VALGSRSRDGEGVEVLGEEGAEMAQASFIEVQKCLSGMDYPASRDDLVEHAKGNGADDHLVDLLRQIPDREYDGPNAVSQEVAAESRDSG
jgi:hypothetical protein